MKLFLPYKKMWDMPLGGTSSEKQVPHWFGNIMFVLAGALFKLLFRYKVTGRENLRGFRSKSGVVVVCPHASFLDVVFVYLAARPKQWVRLMGRDSLFEAAHGFLGQMLSRVGAFPIKRDTSDRAAIKRAARMLKNNEIVGVFPEGTRRGKTANVPKLHGGAAFIARMGHAPILPMCVRNVELVKQKGHRVRFPKISVEYGKPVLLADFGFLPKDERLDGCVWYAMRECFALSQQVAPDAVDMAALFPDAKDYAEVFREHPIPRHTTAEVVASIKADAPDARVPKTESGAQ